MLTDPTLFWSMVAALASVAGVLVGVAALLLPVRDWIVDWRAKRAALASELAVGGRFLNEDDFAGAHRHYVEPNCTNVDPAGTERQRHALSVREPIFHLLDRFIDDTTEGRYLLLLADSGMGKSAALLNYYLRDKRLRLGRRRWLVLVPLGIPGLDVVEAISSVKNKKRKTLMLDSFDEDQSAIADHRARLDELMDASREFRRVIITCRTQFFASDEEIPIETGLARVGPRALGTGPEHEFWKVYLVPLDEKQVRKYLRKRFGWRKRKERRRVRRLVARVSDLCARPMLLSHLPSVELGEVVGGADLWLVYQSIVDAWIDREKRWVPDSDALEGFSKRIAVAMFEGREPRGGERMPASEIEALASLWGIDLAGWQLTGRSLLNRDASGNYKFAHRSIMEFLYVKAFLDDAIEGYEPNPVQWTDEMVQFFRLGVNTRQAEGSDLTHQSAAVVQKVMMVKLAEIGTGAPKDTRLHLAYRRTVRHLSGAGLGRLPTLEGFHLPRPEEQEDEDFSGRGDPAGIVERGLDIAFVDIGVITKCAAEEASGIMDELQQHGWRFAGDEELRLCRSLQDRMHGMDLAEAIGLVGGIIILGVKLRLGLDRKSVQKVGDSVRMLEESFEAERDPDLPVLVGTSQMYDQLDAIGLEIEPIAAKRWSTKSKKRRRT